MPASDVYVIGKSHACVDSKVFLDAVDFTASANSAAQSLDNRQHSFIGFLNVSALGSGCTATVLIEHSPDKTNWFTAITFAAASATGVQEVQAKENLFTYVRANVTLTSGTTTATITCSLHFCQG
jgi:hypothetical protein